MEVLFFTTTVFAVVAGKGARLHNWFVFVDGTIGRVFRFVLNERVVYSHHTRVQGVTFQGVVLPNDLIINIEEPWEGLRHDCVLSFMNWVY